jgi:hypothetical protein
MAKLDTRFISELDVFLAEFDKKFPQKSDSQKQVIKLYNNKIIPLRDDENADKHKKASLWEEF